MSPALSDISEISAGSSSGGSSNGGGSDQDVVEEDIHERELTDPFDELQAFFAGESLPNACSSSTEGKVMWKLSSSGGSLASVRRDYHFAGPSPKWTGSIHVVSFCARNLAWQKNMRAFPYTVCFSLTMNFTCVSYRYCRT